jgi:ABC-type nickel/cobalt efflux system permease component RcnA
MRLVCEFRAALPGPLVDDTAVAFQDSSDSGRLGWREITVEGDGVTVAATGRDLLRTSPSTRLTAYPKDLLSQPLSIGAVAFLVTPGGPTLPPFVAPDAEPVSGPGGAGPSPGQPAAAAPSGAAVPGGVGGTDIPSVFREPNLSPAIWLLALATAIALGAAHALTPGHGKTLVAAYLVATRGSALHAAGLGLSVTVSHTIGILVLAGLVVGAQGALPPDVVARTMPTIAALTIVGVGGWMLVSEVRRRRGAHLDHGHSHDADHGHEDTAHENADHEGVAHTHVPASRTITWRGLALLGLAGGIIPSTSALLILLGTIAAGRPLFGLVLVVAFGVGMALVLTAVGLVLVRGRGWLERRSMPSSLRRLAGGAPLAASVLIVCVGLWLTAQAVAGRPVL